MYFWGKPFIALVKKWNLKENIYSDGPKSHINKANTPTMGGILIIASTATSTIIWGNFSNHYLYIILLATLLLGIVGFWDDYLKSVLRIEKGMKAKVKLFWQICIAFIFAITIYYFPYYPEEQRNITTELFIPFMKEPLFFMGQFAIFFWGLIVLSTSNAVNLTDGLDGLAIGLCAIVLGTLGIIAYLSGIASIANYLLIPFIPEVNELCILLSATLGASIGFLWFNSYPATIFMGDTGSLAIGGLIGMVSICIKREIMLLLLGGIFVIEALSVIVQVLFYKSQQRRLLLMAPIHHHFELKGVHESKIVIRFWIIGSFLSLLSLATLKII